MDVVVSLTTSLSSRNAARDRFSAQTEDLTSNLILSPPRALGNPSHRLLYLNLSQLPTTTSLELKPCYV